MGTVLLFYILTHYSLKNYHRKKDRYFCRIISKENLAELNGENGLLARQKSLHHREIEGTFINYEK